MNRGCNKVRFPTKKEALSCKNHITSLGRKKLPKRVYFCSKCNAWHQTSVNKNKEVIYEFKLPKDRKIVEKVNKLLFDLDK